MKDFVILLHLAIFSYVCSAQNENKNWIVGDYVVSFDNNNFVLNPLSRINHNVGQFTSISNKDGELLFFTNGTTLWTSEFEAPSNGHFLKGASRGHALFLPNLSNENYYYLFSADGGTFFTPPFNLYYSILDARLNDGKGDIISTQKNILLNDNITDYIAGATGVCGTIWLITQEFDSNRFFSYEITPKGISDPVISTVNANILNKGDGLIRVSPNSKVIAIFNPTQEEIKLFDFNQATGKISGGITLPLEKSGLGFYSGAFSSDNSKLYVYAPQKAIINEEGRIYQFDISSLNQEQILNSKTLIHQYDKSIGGRSEIQLSPNGMILIEKSGLFLSAILQPNRLGLACEFVDTIVVSESPFSFRNTFQNLVPSPTPAITTDSLFLPLDQQLCQNTQLSLQIQAEGDTYRWQDGSTTKDYQITAPGTYWVDVQKGNCTFTDTLKILPDDSFVALGTDTTICLNESININISPQTNQTYQWQDGTTNPNYTISEAGLYWVESTDSLCSFRDSITVEVEEIVTNLPADTFICLNEIILLNLENSNLVYEWQDGSTLAAYSILEPGTYWVEAQKGSCQIRDTINVSRGGTPNFLPNDTTLCNVSEFIIRPEVPFEGIAWFQQPSLADSLLVTESGVYRAIIIEQKGCNDEDSISVTFTNLSLALPTDTTICDADDFLIDLENLTGNLTWQDGSTDQTFLVTESGNYWATLSDGECQVSDSIAVLLEALNLDLGNDTTLCDNSTLNLSIPISNATYEWQDGSIAQNLSIESAGIYWANVAKDNCVATDSILVSIKPPSIIDLGKDTTLCLDENLTLSAPSMLTNFQWQDGTTNNTQTVTQSDIYWIAGQIENCPVQDSITVTFEDCPEDTRLCQAYLPNSFSPNGDGINDELTLLTDCELAVYEMEVYDRWGNLLFSSTDIRKTWDGSYKEENLEQGVYLWVLRFQFAGTNLLNTKSETVTLTR